MPRAAYPKDAPPLDADGMLGAEHSGHFHPYRWDLRWNDDYSRFVPVALDWWDDASYRDYQAWDGDDEPEAVEPVSRPLVVDTAWQDDDIPF